MRLKRIAQSVSNVNKYNGIVQKRVGIGVGTGVWTRVGTGVGIGWVLSMV